ncbi:LacI family DNA-binding transcriptional regulator [Sphingomonas sp. R3G8C]|uniref:LacI family DNA-binding transcriptional regulator n=1 Tax=Novosphingobium rhizosphaerae TaxID=1551649 RepID=UPI0015C6DBB0
MNLKEFAELAGVSTATASRALSRSGRVSEETRQRIAVLAEKLGYQPNAIARNLRTQRTMTVGVLVPMGHDALQHLSDPFFNTMIGFLADALVDRGYDLLLSRVLPSDERWLDRYIGSGRVDGIIVIGQSDQYHVIESVARRYHPMVVWGGQLPGQQHCAVGSDNFRGGQLAAEHLVAQGCRKLAYAGPDRGAEFGERLAGVRAALAAAGLPEPVELPSHFEPDAAYRDLAAHLLSLGHMPDGIVAGADVTAAGMIKALTELGHDVPGAVRVIGYDGLPLGEQLTPTLTTIDQQLREGARIMVDLVLRRIAGEDTPSVRIAPRLLQRAST